MSKTEEKDRLPRFHPGDKIYKLFEYNKVVILGKEEEFLVEIKKKSDNRR